MTQAFNLSQLANLVNTSGQLNAATGLYNQTPVANGGTGVATLASGSVVIGAGTSAVTTVAAGTLGNVLTSNGTTWISQVAAGGAPIVTIYTSPASWTKSPTLKAVKVTVCSGGGGGSGSNPTTPGKGGGGGSVGYLYLPAVSVPGPLTVTVGVGGTTGGVNGNGGPGGASSFGALISNPGGGGATVPTVGAGGTFTPSPVRWGANGEPGQVRTGGASAFQFGYGLQDLAGVGYGAGGGGRPSTPSSVGIAGNAGVIIVEEFY